MENININNAEPKGDLKGQSSKFEEVLGFSSPIDFAYIFLFLFICKDYVIKRLCLKKSKRTFQGSHKVKFRSNKIALCQF